MLGRLINRHKNCGGFILPDMNNSFTGMQYGYCPKCNERKLTLNDYDSKEEHITLYTINNLETKEYLLYDDDNGNTFTITFESEEQARDFATMHGILDGYEVKPNVAMYCDNAPVTNGRMIINKGDE